MRTKYFALIVISLISFKSFSFSQELIIDEETFEYLSLSDEEEATIEENQLDPLHEDHLYGIWKSACINKPKQSERFIKAFSVNKNKEHVFIYIAHVYRGKNCKKNNSLLVIQSSGYYALKNNKRNLAEVHNKNAFIKITTSNKKILKNLQEKCPHKTFKLNQTTKIFSEERGKNCKKDDLLNPTEVDKIHLTDKGHILTYESKTGKGLRLTKIKLPKTHKLDKNHGQHSSD